MFAERVWGRGHVGKNGGMSRFVFLPVDSECDQLVKQKDTECGSGGGGGGSSLFQRESLRPSPESGWDERKKGAEYNIMNIMTNKGTFQPFVVAFLQPPRRPTRVWQLDSEWPRPGWIPLILLWIFPTFATKCFPLLSFTWNYCHTLEPRWRDTLSELWQITPYLNVNLSFFLCLNSVKL